MSAFEGASDRASDRDRFAAGAVAGASAAGSSPERAGGGVGGPVQFAETRGFSRGYDEGEVDAYVARVQRQLADLSRELQEVREEAQHLRDRLMRGDNERVLQSLNVLTRAQKTADETVSRADEHSARVMQEARALHDEARRQATRIVDESHRRAQEVAEQAVADHGELARQTAYLETMRDVARTQIEAFLMGLYDRVATEFGQADPRAAAEALPRTTGRVRPSAAALVRDGSDPGSVAGRSADMSPSVAAAAPDSGAPREELTAAPR
jgi:DivIVA domain-containing protein